MMKTGKIQSKLKKQQDKNFAFLQEKKVILMGVNQFINSNVKQIENSHKVQAYTGDLKNNLIFYDNPIEVLNQDRAALYFEKGT